MLLTGTPLPNPALGCHLLYNRTIQTEKHGTPHSELEIELLNLVRRATQKSQAYDCIADFLWCSTAYTVCTAELRLQGYNEGDVVSDDAIRKLPDQLYLCNKYATQASKIKATTLEYTCLRFEEYVSRWHGDIVLDSRLKANDLSQVIDINAILKGANASAASTEPVSLRLCAQDFAEMMDIETVFSGIASDGYDVSRIKYKVKDTFKHLFAGRVDVGFKFVANGTSDRLYIGGSGYDLNMNYNHGASNLFCGLKVHWSTLAEGVYVGTKANLSTLQETIDGVDVDVDSSRKFYLDEMFLSDALDVQKSSVNEKGYGVICSLSMVACPAGLRFHIDDGAAANAVPKSPVLAVIEREQASEALSLPWWRPLWTFREWVTSSIHRLSKELLCVTKIMGYVAEALRSVSGAVNLCDSSNSLFVSALSTFVKSTTPIRVIAMVINLADNYRLALNTVGSVVAAIGPRNPQVYSAAINTMVDRLMHEATDESKAVALNRYFQAVFGKGRALGDAYLRSAHAHKLLDVTQQQRLHYMLDADSKPVDEETITPAAFAPDNDYTLDTVFPTELQLAEPTIATMPYTVPTIRQQRAYVDGAELPLSRKPAVYVNNSTSLIGLINAVF